MARMLERIDTVPDRLPMYCPSRQSPFRGRYESDEVCVRHPLRSAIELPCCFDFERFHEPPQ
jgi:hypothetical protein